MYIKITYATYRWPVKVDIANDAIILNHKAVLHLDLLKLCKFLGKIYTLPETNSSHLKIGETPNGNSYSNHQFSGAMSVAGRVVSLWKKWLEWLKVFFSTDHDWMSRWKLGSHALVNGTLLSNYIDGIYLTVMTQYITSDLWYRVWSNGTKSASCSWSLICPWAFQLWVFAPVPLCQLFFQLLRNSRRILMIKWPDVGRGSMAPIRDHTGTPCHIDLLSWRIIPAGW